MYSIKQFIPVKIKKYLYIKNYFNKAQSAYFERKKFKEYLQTTKPTKRVFILDACDHRNLGDQAILYSEIEFIKDFLQGYEIVSVGLGSFSNLVGIISKEVSPGDLIFLHGGGNLGNEYKIAENTRRKIIQLFPNNKIILFPQTMYFSDDAEGKKELSSSIEIYSRHKSLTLVAREKTSYNLMTKFFSNNNVLLTPDIVLYLNKSKKKTEREGALFCCRNDIEGVLSQSEKQKILDNLDSYFKRVSITDTVGENNFKAVEEKFEEFKRAEIVITDRLHGMVFAAITGTPCIALTNYNYKVSGTYEWIKHLSYIRFVENTEEIDKNILDLKDLKNTSYSNKFAIKHYNQIIEAINEKNLNSNNNVFSQIF
ncbi:polysaccharide pyruvyl transferase family protein [Robertmurraya sp. FSL R5-0851]|uniref:polysaccharide pyruvyl transferase family protein n=1 Tax=Robertmurraya sp. FSL R5-0851 TaxID=2921584 RepID=UPI0030FBB46F